MAGSQVFDKVPTTTHGQPIEAGMGAVPPPANPITVAVAPPEHGGGAVIRQTEAPREIAEGAGNYLPPDKAANAQELAPLKGPKGPPLTGKALVAAVGPKRAAEIEAMAAAGPGTVTNPTPTQQPGPPPAPPEPKTPAVSAAGALSQSAQQVGLRRPQRRTPAPSVHTTPVETTTSPAPEAPAPPESGLTGDADVAAHITEDVPIAPIQPHQKAASNTDSPARGVPQPITDPGKKITGGFGEVTDGQYHPLNGHELKTLVEALMDTVHGQIQDDLRFSMALTYPRVRVRVQIIVEGYTEADSFAIERLKPEPKDGKPGSTPLALAQQLADQVVFVVVAERREMDDAGNPVTAPNAMRQELGIEVPHKQRIETPTGFTLADRRV